MREIELRAWNKEAEKMFFAGGFISTGDVIDSARKHGYPLMQFTGLRDKNGVKIFCGDLLNIFFTSNDGEHIHDCVYSASVGQLGDIQFNFVKLLWEDMGHNQYPSSTVLCARYDTLDYEYEGEQLKLKVPDSWGENHLLRNKWKANDKSFYFEVIGNIHQHPHLLEQKK